MNATIAQAVAALAAGRPIIVVDDEDRENEGDLILLADRCTPEAIGFMVRHSSGVLCAPMSAAFAQRLDLPPMTAVNEDAKGTAYTVSCDARTGVSTGISAADRARTLQVLADPASGPGDLTRPGHVFPLIAVAGGVHVRPGHTEATVDLARLAGSEPVGVIAELVHDTGEMMRLPALEAFAAEHDIPLISIAQMIAELPGPEVEPPHGSPSAVPEPTPLPTPHGILQARAWRLGRAEQLSLSVPSTEEVPLVRVHSGCLTGDVFGSYRCDCGEQLDAALAEIGARGGTLVYLPEHEGRGIGLLAKLAAYRLQDTGLDTVDANLSLGLPADARDYAAAAAILQALGHTRIRLMTNNPAKAAALSAHGIDVVEEIRLEIPAREENRRYLATKRDRMAHHLPAGL